MTNQSETAEALQLVRPHYTETYKIIKHDSPEGSRVSMNKRILALLRQGSPKAIPDRHILSIGAGRQSLEKQLFAHTGRPDRWWEVVAHKPVL